MLAQLSINWLAMNDVAIRQCFVPRRVPKLVRYLEQLWQNGHVMSFILMNAPEALANDRGVQLNTSWKS